VFLKEFFKTKIWRSFSTYFSQNTPTLSDSRGDPIICILLLDFTHLLLRCVYVCNLHVIEILLSYERMGIKISFEKEAKGNSEMAY